MEATHLKKATTKLATAAARAKQTARTFVGGFAPRSQIISLPRDDMLRDLPTPARNS